MKRTPNLPRRPAVLAAAAVLVCGSRIANATPEFPDVVVKTLGLSAVTIDPPQGCMLCHATDSGGTALRSFGLLLQQYGAQPYADATLEQALAAVGQEQPALIADIKAGRDPNEDASASSLPTPQYGCAQARAGASSAPWPVTALAVCAGIFALRLRTRRGAKRFRR